VRPPSAGSGRVPDRPFSGHGARQGSRDISRGRAAGPARAPGSGAMECHSPPMVSHLESLAQAWRRSALGTGSRASPATVAPSRRSRFMAPRAAAGGACDPDVESMAWGLVHVGDGRVHHGTDQGFQEGVEIGGRFRISLHRGHAGVTYGLPRTPTFTERLLFTRPRLSAVSSSNDAHIGLGELSDDLNASSGPPYVVPSEYKGTGRPTALSCRAGRRGATHRLPWRSGGLRCAGPPYQFAL
jgi:hypothetical protein